MLFGELHLLKIHFAWEIVFVGSSAYVPFGNKLVDFVSNL